MPYADEMARYREIRVGKSSNGYEGFAPERLSRPNATV
jgi:hypothetical protein